MSALVCVSVCFSVRDHVSGTTRPIFNSFFCALLMAEARSSSGGVAIYTSGFTDYVIFTHNGPYVPSGTEISMHHCLLLLLLLQKLHDEHERLNGSKENGSRILQYYAFLSTSVPVIPLIQTVTYITYVYIKMFHVISELIF